MANEEKDAEIETVLGFNPLAGELEEFSVPRELLVELARRSDFVDVDFQLSRTLRNPSFFAIGLRKHWADAKVDESGYCFAGYDQAAGMLPELYPPKDHHPPDGYLFVAMFNPKRELIRFGLEKCDPNDSRRPDGASHRFFGPMWPN